MIVGDLVSFYGDNVCWLSLDEYISWYDAEEFTAHWCDRHFDRNATGLLLSRLMVRDSFMYCVFVADKLVRVRKSVLEPVL